MDLAPAKSLGADDGVTLTTDDTQASLDFGPDGVASHGNLHATITPLDPATLGPVAPGQTPVGTSRAAHIPVALGYSR